MITDYWIKDFDTLEFRDICNACALHFIVLLLQSLVVLYLIAIKANYTKLTESF